MAARKREHLLATARQMFCTYGFHAVSVDDILDHADVARMTLYKNFGSKDDLILATLRREDQMFRQWLAGSVEAHARRPKDRMLALFDALAERFATDGYYGCAFIRASIEFPDPHHRVHRAACEHKEMIRSYLRALVAESGAKDVNSLSEQIYLLFEGAICASQLYGAAWPAQQARAAAAKLLQP